MRILPPSLPVWILMPPPSPSALIETSVPSPAFFPSEPQAARSILGGLRNAGRMANLLGALVLYYPLVVGDTNLASPSPSGDVQQDFPPCLPLRSELGTPSGRHRVCPTV